VSRQARYAHSANSETVSRGAGLLETRLVLLGDTHEAHFDVEDARAPVELGEVLQLEIPCGEVLREISTSSEDLIFVEHAEPLYLRVVVF